MCANCVLGASNPHNVHKHFYILIPERGECEICSRNLDIHVMELVPCNFYSFRKETKKA